MTSADFEKWVTENGTGRRVNKHCNGIDWTFADMADGWVAIFERNTENGNYYPAIQAADEAHAESFIIMRERPRVPIQPLI